MLFMLLSAVVGQEVGNFNWIATVDCLQRDAVVDAALKIRTYWTDRDGLWARKKKVRDRAIKLPNFCYVPFSGDNRVVNNMTKVKGVINVSPDYAVRSDSVLWGLNRIDQAKLPLSVGVEFSQEYWGEGQVIYILDSGINVAHGDFLGRAITHGIDKDGHGTHVAAIAAGGLHGVASKARVVGFDVLSGKLVSDVIEGIGRVLNSTIGQQAAVLSMSLTTDKNSTELYEAVSLAAKSMVVVVAAGNQGVDACQNVFPAGMGGCRLNRKGCVPNVITVGASTSTDARAGFSNGGTCVDIYAPGVDIESAWIGSPYATYSASGTSMATPFVSGVVATLLEKHGGSRERAVADLFSNSSFFLGSNSRLLRATTGPNTKPREIEPSGIVGRKQVQLYENCSAENILLGMPATGLMLPNTNLFFPTMTNRDACDAYMTNLAGRILVVSSGGKCDYVGKAARAYAASASGMIIERTEINQLVTSPLIKNATHDFSDKLPVVMVPFGALRLRSNGLRMCVGSVPKTSGPSTRTPTTSGPTTSRPTTPRPTPTTSKPTITSRPTPRPTPTTSKPTITSRPTTPRPTPTASKPTTSRPTPRPTPTTSKPTITSK
jgi:subtilisin family serine protease